MARVHIPSALHSLTGGVERVQVRARDVRSLMAELDARFPGLAERLGSGMAIAIDGDIVQQPLLEAIAPESEIHFLPSISGG